MRVEINNPEFVEGTEFDIGGLLLVNGKAVEFSDEDAELYEAKHGQSLKKALNGVRYVKVGGKRSTADAEATQEVTPEKEGES